MRAAYYEVNGSAREVLRIGEVETPLAGPGEVRVKLASSGVNPSDVKSRQGLTRKIAWPRLIPHSDGAGVIDQVGNGIPNSRIGERVWVWNGQWKRAFGTAAEYITLPSTQAVRLPDTVSFEAGACLGIPAMTAVHAVTLAAPTKGSTLLVSGGAGAVSRFATSASITSPWEIGATSRTGHSSSTTSAIRSRRPNRATTGSAPSRFSSTRTTAISARARARPRPVLGIPPIPDVNYLTR